MWRRSFFVFAVLCLLLAAPVLGRAQQQEPNIYIFVAEWDVSRAQWNDFVAFSEKNSRPVLEKFAADGTLMSWGSFSTIVHETKGITHGSWWAAWSLAGVEKVREELIKLPPNPAAAGAPHHDYLLRAVLHRARPATSGSGYILVGTTVVKPGKGQEWRALWDKYNKPVYDELLGNGTINSYEVDVEQVHTENPGLRYVVSFAPTAEAMDKARAAFVAAEQKRSAEENRAIGQAFSETVEPGAHRDYLARVTSSWHK